MATLVLGAVGGLIGGAIGGAVGGVVAIGGGILASTFGAQLGTIIGGAAGSYVDQLAINAIFPQAIKGPRANAFPDIQSGDGSPVNYPIGRSVRLPCTLMWAGPIKERRRSRRSGKGGGGKTTTYHYYRDCAYHIAGRPVENVLKLIAEGNTLFEYDGGGSDQDNGGKSLQVSDNQGRISVEGTLIRINNQLSLEQSKGKITSETQNGGPNLANFVVGSALTIAGFTNAINNQPARVEAKGTNIDGSTWILCDHSPSGGWATEDPPSGQLISLSQISEGFVNGLVSGTFFHIGDQTAPDPIIEAVEGAGNVPVWFGDTYVSIQNMALQRFGNRAPFLEAIVEADSFSTLNFALAELLTLGGLSTQHFDVSACSSIEFDGYNFQGFAQPATAITQLMQFYDVAARWSNDRLVFFPAKDRPIIELRESDLGAAVGEREGDGAPTLLETGDQAEVTLPNSITVSYLDRTNDLAKGSERYVRQNSLFQGAQEVSIPVVSNAATAREAARRIFWDGANARETFRVTLPANDIGLAVEENDRVHVNARGREYEFVAARTVRDEPGVIEVLGHRTPARIVGGDILAEYPYPPPPAAEDPDGGGLDSVPAIPVLQLAVMDLRPLVDIHASIPGVYYAAAVRDASAEFLTAELFVSEDAGSSFESAASIIVEATMGTLETAFQNETADLREIDTTESFKVRLFRPDSELESVTTAQMQAGKNWAWVAGEVIAFTSAVLQADGTYLISNVVRGLRGTEELQAQHGVGSLFVLLEENGVGFAPLPLRLDGEDLEFRAVSVGGMVSEAVSFPLTFAANTLRPMPLANYLVLRDGSDVITVTWDRQTRAVSDPLAVVEAPVLQPPERYRITFDDGSTVVEKHVTDARNFVYPTAAQITDGFTPGNPIDVATREVGVVGDGPTSELPLS